jgi:hypothetical protein
MRYREQQLGYRTVTNPGGLVMPMSIHDGKNFPAYVKPIQWADFTPFSRVGQGFTRTERYVEFQDRLLEWVEDLAECIRKAPVWHEEWLSKAWTDDPIASFDSPTTSSFFPSLG